MDRITIAKGDGIGPDIWAAAVRVFDAAVEKAYGGERKIVWKEVLTGQKAFPVNFCDASGVEQFGTQPLHFDCQIDQPQFVLFV